MAMKVQFDPRIFRPSSPLEPRRDKGEDFVQVLKEAIKEVNRLQLEADKAIQDLALGKADLHTTMIALEKAEISFRMMMQIRNKIIRAYEEMMRMPL